MKPVDPFVEHYRRKVLRFEIDPDVAAMQIGAYNERESAVSERRLLSPPRPKPLKHRGFRAQTARLERRA